MPPASCTNGHFLAGLKESALLCCPGTQLVSHSQTTSMTSYILSPDVTRVQFNANFNEPLIFLQSHMLLSCSWLPFLPRHWMGHHKMWPFNSYSTVYDNIPWALAREWFPSSHETASVFFFWFFTFCFSLQQLTAVHKSSYCVTMVNLADEFQTKNLIKNLDSGHQMAFHAALGVAWVWPGGYETRFQSS